MLAQKILDSSLEVLPIQSDPATFDQMANLFERAFGNANIGLDFLDWQYNKNPNGPVVGFNAFHGELLVAHYATIPVRSLLFGKSQLGLLSLNTATDPNFQGRGLFKTLAAKTYDWAKSKGFEFVVGVANQNSIHGFKKMNFQMVGPLESRLVHNIKPQEPPPTLDYSGLWSEEALRWRLGRPDKKYYFDSHSDRINILAETERKLIHALPLQCPHSHLPSFVAPNPKVWSPLKLWIGLDTSINWKRNFNFKIPQKWRSVALNLIFKDLQGSREINPQKVKFWAFDFDAY